ncbi:hypothetical protein TKK_0003912 [Trichogramma kaykai]
MQGNQHQLTWRFKHVKENSYSASGVLSPKSMQHKSVKSKHRDDLMKSIFGSSSSLNQFDRDYGKQADNNSPSKDLSNNGRTSKHDKKYLSSANGGLSPKYIQHKSVKSKHGDNSIKSLYGSFSSLSQSDRDDGNEAAIHSPFNESSNLSEGESEIERSKHENKSKLVETKNQCLCSELPNLTEQETSKFLRIVQILRNRSSNPRASHLHTEKSDSNAKMAELIPGSNIWFEELKLDQMNYRKPRELARRVMKMIIPEEVLRESTSTGRNGRKAIPENIFFSVLRYINENANKKKYKISQSECRTVMTSMCATLRNPRDGNGDKKKQRDNREDDSDEPAEEILRI